jgi:signal transduction histidine kinase
MKNFLALFLLCASLLLAGPRVAAATGADPLTPAERAWLAAHPDIVLGVGEEWAPAVVRNANGQFSGFAFDHLELLNRKLETHFRLEAGPWPTLVEQAEARRIAGLTLTVALESRKNHFLFTEPFHAVQYFIYLRTGQSAPNDGLDELRGRQVGYLKGILYLRNLLAAHPGVGATPFDNTQDMAYALLRGDINAVIDSYGLEYWRASNGILGFAPARLLTGSETPLVMSIRKDWPELVTILDKGLTMITPEEMADLYRRWFGQDYLNRIAPRVTLTAEEKAWLKEHPVLRAGIDAHWAPVEFMDEKGAPQGISVAYLRRLEKLLSVRVEFAADLTWADAKRQLFDSRLDLLPSMAVTPDRQRSAHFTEPYLSFPAAIFSAADVAYLGGLRALEGRTVAVVRDEATQDWLRNDWPQLTLLPVANTQEALRKTAEGEAFAFVGNLVTTSYYIGQSGLTQIKVVGETPYAYQLGMGVRPDGPILAGILQKGLDAIPKSERDAIYHDWISIQYQHAIDYGTLWTVLTLAGLALFVIFYWNRRLTLEVEQRRHAEAALRDAKEAAEQANRAKSMFLANMSHELRTPLNAVLGFVQLLEWQGALSDWQRRSIQSIRRGGQQLLSLINDVLEMAKIEANRFEPHPVLWDSAELAQELTGLFQARAEQKDLDFRIEYATPLPRALFCDLKCLRQILVNLLDNAIKFTERGEVILRLAFQDDVLRAEVADTGMGIPAERLDDIFEPFRQAGDAQARAQGVGLGLAITRELATRLGGALTVESALSRGSTFRLRIPAQAASPPLAAGAAESPVPPIHGYRRTQGDGPLRLLIVDDETPNRAILRNLAEPLGFMVEEARNGRECLEKAPVWRPDLILMDLRMPEMDGLEAARALRDLPAFRQTPLVAITAAAFAEDREQALAAGCNAHLAKPVLLDTLLETLGTWLPLQWLYDDTSPAMQPLPEPLPTDPGPSGPPVGRILVVDDEPENRYFLSRLLAGQGWRVDTTESGERALDITDAIVGETRLDLILLDVLMPAGIDGIETCRRLKSREGLRNTPVIFLTGRDDEDIMVRAFAAGGADYVLKPFNAQVLLSRVRTHARLGLLSSHLEAELAQRTAALNNANDRLRQLAMETTLIEERERKRLAGELHDSPMQKLALAQIQIIAGARHRDAEGEQQLDTGLELLREALRELRTLQFELSPPQLYQEGLAAALEWLASYAAARFGLNLSFTRPETAPVLDRQLAIVLFQCARELVYNVAKHAGASAGRIELEAWEQTLRLTVSDNGHGFPPALVDQPGSAGGGYGLFSVRERLALLGGSLGVASDAAGSRVTIHAPLHALRPAGEKLEVETS